MIERDTPDGETLTPAEAFAAVSNEMRVTILQALSEAKGAVTFSDLRAEVGMKDSARFNYHLKQLRPQFVAKTDDGYEVRYAGRAVVHAILVGTFTTDVSREPFDIGGECVACGAGLQAEYREEMLTVGCPSCDRLTRGTPRGLRPAGPRGVRARQRRRLLSLCRADGGLARSPDEVTGDACLADGPDGFEVGVNHDCPQCGAHVGAAVGMGLLDDGPDVVTCERVTGTAGTESKAEV